MVVSMSEATTEVERKFAKQVALAIVIGQVADLITLGCFKPQLFDLCLQLFTHEEKHPDGASLPLNATIAWQRDPRELRHFATFDSGGKPRKRQHDSQDGSNFTKRSLGLSVLRRAVVYGSTIYSCV